MFHIIVWKKILGQSYEILENAYKIEDLIIKKSFQKIQRYSENKKWHIFAGLLIGHICETWEIWKTFHFKSHMVINISNSLFNVK